jgi:glycosyltransferase involved in cell wall biosynthesis
MATPLKLCYVADASSIHVRRWLSFFVKRNHQIYCLSDKPGDIDGVEVILLPNRDTLLQTQKKVNKTAVLQARAAKIRESIQKIQPDILHAHFLYQRGWSASLAEFHPLIITLLGSDINLPTQHYRSRVHQWRDELLNTFALRQADLITGVSADLCQVAGEMTFDQVPIELIPIGTDLSLFHADVDKARVQELREQLSIPHDAFVVLSPRQMTPLYNIETIIEAIPSVLAHEPNTIFLLKDTFCNTDERKAYVEKLRQQAEVLGDSLGRSSSI